VGLQPLSSYNNQLIRSNSLKKNAHWPKVTLQRKAHYDGKVRFATVSKLLAPPTYARKAGLEPVSHGTEDRQAPPILPAPPALETYPPPFKNRIKGRSAFICYRGFILCTSCGTKSWKFWSHRTPNTEQRQRTTTTLEQRQHAWTTTTDRRSIWTSTSVPTSNRFRIGIEQDRTPDRFLRFTKLLNRKSTPDFRFRIEQSNSNSTSYSSSWFLLVVRSLCIAGPTLPPWVMVFLPTRETSHLMVQEM